MNTSDDLIYKITVTINQVTEFKSVKYWLTENFGIQLSEENIEGIWRFFTYSAMTLHRPEILDLEVGFKNKEDAVAFKLRWT